MATTDKQLDSRLRGNDSGLSLVFAIPDHPVVDSADGAAVRIAMTVGRGRRHQNEAAATGEQARTTRGEGYPA